MLPAAVYLAAAAVATAAAAAIADDWQTSIDPISKPGTDYKAGLAALY